MAQQQQLQGSALEALAKSIAATLKPDFDGKDVGITRSGDKIILPAIPTPMHEKTAIEYLERKLKHDEMTVGIHEDIDCHPLEGAWALKKVLEQKFGWAESKEREVNGFFGKQKIPAQLVSLEVSLGKFEQVVWGNFQLPGMEDSELHCSASRRNGRFIFNIAGEIKKKFETEAKDIAQRVRDFLKANSLYKGQAIRLTVDENGEINHQEPPKFVDLSRVNESELIFSEDLEKQVQTNLFAPIEHTNMCRSHKIPLKRGVLLEGAYGTGKTLAAYVTAKKAVKNGWTFIYLERVGGLDKALEFAKRYEPCVIFAEDIDRVMAGERDIEVDDILNTIDGIESKNSEIMVILTTNDVNSIERAMLRPGRLDAVISFHAPDAKAAEKLIRLYARGLIEENTNLTAAGKELAGTIPAVIREVVERSKLYAISRGEGDSLKLNGDDIAVAAKGMKGHLALLESPKPDPTAEELFSQSFKTLVHNSFNGNVDTLAEKLYELMN